MATATKKTQEAFFNSYADIKSRLQEPIPSDKLSVKTIQKHRIEFVNITAMKDLLDERAGIWEATVVDTKVAGDNLIVIVRIAIHAEDGVFVQDGTGLEALQVSGYGDPFSNAYAQAFRRACETHGLSRELWRKSETRSQANAGTLTRQPPQGCSGSPKATPALLEVLRRKVDEAGIDGTAFVQANFPDCGTVGDLTHEAVNYLLVELMKGRAAA